jgi:hypothetical protein
MLRKIGFLTQEQFDTAIERSRLSPKGRTAAHRVLVGQESQAAVAKEINVSREKVRQYCYAVYRRHITLTACPDGWISTTVCLPRSALKDVQQLEKKLRMEYERERSKHETKSSKT